VQSYANHLVHEQLFGSIREEHYSIDIPGNQNRTGDVAIRLALPVFHFMQEPSRFGQQ
jgi:hypothetical protein